MMKAESPKKISPWPGNATRSSPSFLCRDRHRFPQNQKQTNSMTKTIKSNAAKAKQFFADKMAFRTGPVEISPQIEKRGEVAIIDVREAKDFKKGHVPGADRKSTRLNSSHLGISY